MNTLQWRLVPEEEEQNPPTAAELDADAPACEQETFEDLEHLHSRAATVTSVLKDILSCPAPTHWGINE